MQCHDQNDIEKGRWEQIKYVAEYSKISLHLLCNISNHVYFFTKNIPSPNPSFILYNI